jgi:hypothetical protein
MEPRERNLKISVLMEFPDKLKSVLSSKNTPDPDKPYRENGWTVRQVVHHLADAHMNGYIRMKLILTENKPILKTYQQDAWADLPEAKTGALQPSLSILEGLHKRWVDLLMNLPDSDWQRTGNHPESGKLTLDDLLDIYVRHCENHLKQISGQYQGK